MADTVAVKLVLDVHMPDDLDATALGQSIADAITIAGGELTGTRVLRKGPRVGAPASDGTRRLRLVKG